MRIHYFFVVLAMGLGLGSSGYAAQTKVPKEVQAFVDRVEGCLHWGGESGSGNAEREAQVQEGVKKLHCDKLKSDASKLQKKYAKNAAATAALQSVNEEWRAGMEESLFEK